MNSEFMIGWFMAIKSLSVQGLELRRALVLSRRNWSRKSRCRRSTSGQLLAGRRKSSSIGPRRRFHYSVTVSCPHDPGHSRSQEQRKLKQKNKTKQKTRQTKSSLSFPIFLFCLTSLSCCPHQAVGGDRTRHFSISVSLPISSLEILRQL